MDRSCSDIIPSRNEPDGGEGRAVTLRLIFLGEPGGWEREKETKKPVLITLHRDTLGLVSCQDARIHRKGVILPR